MNASSTDDVSRVVRKTGSAEIMSEGGVHSFISEASAYICARSVMATAHGNTINLMQTRSFRVRGIASILARYWRLFFCSITAVAIWSSACVLFTSALAQTAASNRDECESVLGPDALPWVKADCLPSLCLLWVKGAENSLPPLFFLLAFALIFRTNRCYDRWWEGRVLWQRLIDCSIDLSIKNRRWIVEPALADRVANFVVVFAYASKAMLRGISLDAPGYGSELVRKGIPNCIK